MAAAAVHRVWRLTLELLSPRGSRRALVGQIALTQARISASAKKSVVAAVRHGRGMAAAYVCCAKWLLGSSSMRKFPSAGRSELRTSY